MLSKSNGYEKFRFFWKKVATRFLFVSFCCCENPKKYFRSNSIPILLLVQRANQSRKYVKPKAKQVQNVVISTPALETYRTVSSSPTKLLSKDWKFSFRWYDVKKFMFEQWKEFILDKNIMDRRFASVSRGEDLEDDDSLYTDSVLRYSSTLYSVSQVFWTQGRFQVLYSQVLKYSVLRCLRNLYSSILFSGNQVLFTQFLKYFVLRYVLKYSILRFSSILYPGTCIDNLVLEC